MEIEHRGTPLGSSNLQNSCRSDGPCEHDDSGGLKASFQALRNTLRHQLCTSGNLPMFKAEV